MHLSIRTFLISFLISIFFSQFAHAKHATSPVESCAPTYNGKPWSRTKIGMGTVGCFYDNDNSGTSKEGEYEPVSGNWIGGEPWMVSCLDGYDACAFRKIS